MSFSEACWFPRINIMNGYLKSSSCEFESAMCMYVYLIKFGIYTGAEKGTHTKSFLVRIFFITMSLLLASYFRNEGYF